MSVVIWKDGKSELCECNYLQHQLSNGYTLEDVEKAEEPQEASEAEVYYRAKAEELGVKIHHKHKLETIIENVEAAENAG